MSDTERLLTTLIASDIFLAAGIYGVTSNRVESEQSAIPQVLGLAGATIGSLGAFLFTQILLEWYLKYAPWCLGWCGKWCSDEK